MSQPNTKNRIQYLIAYVDELIAVQLNLVLHYKKFQQLEASWRGLVYLIKQISGYDARRVKFKILNVSWLELSKDLLRVAEFDQSQLFLKIYHHEFGQPGGEPFGILVGDYVISHRSACLANDIETLRSIAKVAAAAFAPFVSAVSPDLLGLNDFSSLERGLQLDRTFQQAEYQRWKSMRLDEDARFIGLLLPNVLMRLPYQYRQTRHYPFCYNEEITQPAHYLWGNPAYCFAAVAARAFIQTGWFSAMRGLAKDTLGGRVSGLPTPHFALDHCWLARKAPVNAYITDQQEKNLAEQGFIVLSVIEKTSKAVFYECQSLQKPKMYIEQAASQNSNISSLLHYILCGSRFAHYLKVMARDKIGTFGTAQECEKQLQNWLRQYTAASADLSNDLKIKYPLREAKVQVRERLGAPDRYVCTIHLSPQYQFDHVQTGLQLTTELIHPL